MRTALIWALCGALVIAGVTGCSDGDSDEIDQPEVRSASQVCDGTLTRSAATALERLAGTDKFTELDGTNSFGDPEKFSLKVAAMRLHAEYSDRNDCTLYKADDESGHPLLDIEFEPRTSRPDTTNVTKHILYPFGVHAYTNGDSGAYVYFACPTKRGKESASYVKASMFSSTGQMNPKGTGKDRMTILNAVSRRMAEELGCAAQAKLPAEVPAATPGAG